MSVGEQGRVHAPQGVGPLCESFIYEKIKYIHQLQSVNPRNEAEINEVFQAYSLLFDEVIEQLPASGGLLAEIKAEYESALMVIQSRGKERAANQQRSLVKSCEVPTINNYHKRIKELEFKAAKIKLDNDRIREEIVQMNAEVEAIIKEKELRLKLLQESAPRMTSTIRRSLGFGLEEATSLGQLHKKLEKVREELNEVRIVAEKKYIPAERRTHLRTLLEEKEKVKGEVDEGNALLAQQLKRLKLATEAVATHRSYLQQHQLEPSSLPLEHYIAAVIESNYDNVEDEEPDQDPVKEMEAEMVLDCFEKFNELFQSERFEEAALHAASSPKGVLRTMDTLLKFKHSARSIPGQKPPLLSYCEALMLCAPAYRPLSKEEGLECVQCALDNDGIPLITHWIAQGVLYPSVEVGGLLLSFCKCSDKCECGCVRTAFSVLDRCGEHNLAALCLIKQDKLMTFLSYAKKINYSNADYVKMLCTQPSMAFAEILIQPPPKYAPCITVIEAAGALLAKGMGREAATLALRELQEIGKGRLQQANTSDRIEQSWQSLVVSFQNAGFTDVAVEILSTFAVRKALQNALCSLSQEPLSVESAQDSRPRSRYDVESSLSSSEVTESEYESSGGYSSEVDSEHESSLS